MFTRPVRWRMLWRAVYCILLATTLLLVRLEEASAAKLTARIYEANNDPAQLFFSPVCNVQLNGTIKAGDYSEIKKALDDLSRSHKGVSGAMALCLSGNGGDLREAIKISELFNDWIRVVDADDECISACAILFMLGRPKDFGSFFYYWHPGRFMHYRARLGFHAPKLEFSSANPTQDHVMDAYSRALLTFREIAFAGRVDREWFGTLNKLLDEPRPGEEKTIRDLRQRFSLAIGTFTGLIPADLLLAIMAVPPEKTYFLARVNEALNWGIEVYGFPQPRTLSAVMLAQGCLNVAYVRCLRGGKSNRCLQTPGAHTLWDLEDFVASWPGKPPLKVLSPDEEGASFENSGFRVTAALRKVQEQEGVPSQGILSEVFLMSVLEQNIFEEKEFCEIRATWRSGKLSLMEIDTFNGIHPRSNGQRMLLVDSRAGGKMGAGDGFFQFRPWKMLPAGLSLMDLGENPWKTFEADGNFFSSPADWGPELHHFHNTRPRPWWQK